MTHPFDQQEKTCPRHSRQKVLTKHLTEAGATAVTFECPDCEGVVSELTEETKVLITLLRHRRHVSHLLRELAREFERRADLHDLTTLELDEFEGRVRIQHIVRTYPYDSPEYRESLKDEDSLQLHYQRNSHHPEHYPDGVEGMGFIDFIEMTIDWLGASRTYRNTSFQDGLKGQIKRFKLQPNHLYLIRLIGKWFGE